MRILFIKNGTSLIPSTQADSDRLHKIPNGEVSGDFKVPRNIKHHRKLFAILRMAIANWQGETSWRDEEDLLEALKMECGWVRQGRKLDGTIFYFTRSIDFDHCDQLEFELFYSRVVTVLAHYFKCSPSEIEQNSMEHYQ